jgi:hypothetical protein
LVEAERIRRFDPMWLYVSKYEYESDMEKMERNRGKAATSGAVFHIRRVRESMVATAIIL